MALRQWTAVVVMLFAANAYAGSRVAATHAALATSSPAATRIGLSVLKNGGNAIDAAVAVSFALAVLEPKATGLGGGGFLTYYDAETGAVWTLDFREAAPAAAKRPPGNAAFSGVLAAAVPGFVAGLDAMHGHFGSRPWRELVAPAQRLAKDDLAKTLLRIGEQGAHDFYDGELANKLVAAVQTAGGAFSFRDLRDYKPIWRAPVRISFRGADIYSVAPPAAGGLVIGSILKIVPEAPVRKAGLESPAYIHLLTEAERRAAIDRDKYLADPASGRVPMHDLLSDERAALWRASIDPNRVTPTSVLAEPGSVTQPAGHTTHVSIVDTKGNVVSLTTSIGEEGGSGFTVPGLGILLNSAMNDFSAASFTANSVAGGNRPASPLAPVIVLRGGKPILAIGTPGGAAISTTMAQILLDMLVFNRMPADAIAAPRWSQQAVPEEISYEQGRTPQATLDALLALGHGVRARESIGDVQAVSIDGKKLLAISDVRHGGAAGGY
ncbi:MAG TPA: gamma-glutamyltransferase family protein [Thermoanaerobaculia bacterium]|nr:gamma-glutamyltransferase family protein [Thermoanaerobaculia bacterium]